MAPERLVHGEIDAVIRRTPARAVAAPLAVRLPAPSPVIDHPPSSAPPSGDTAPRAGAPGAGEDGSRLPCGVDPLALAERVREGRPAVDPVHEASCPWCGGLLDRLRESDELLRALADESTPAPRRRLVGPVLARLRGPDDELELAGSTLGRTTVSRRVLRELAQRAAGSVDGVRAASVAMTGDRAALAATVHLAADLGPVLPDLADDVRAAVVTAVRRTAGLEVVRVDVVVDDVLA